MWKNFEPGYFFLCVLLLEADTVIPVLLPLSHNCIVVCMPSFCICRYKRIAVQQSTEI